MQATSHPYQPGSWVSHIWCIVALSTCLPKGGAHSRPLSNSPTHLSVLSTSVPPWDDRLQGITVSDSDGMVCPASKSLRIKATSPDCKLSSAMNEGTRKEGTVTLH